MLQLGLIVIMGRFGIFAIAISQRTPRLHRLRQRNHHSKRRSAFDNHRPICFYSGQCLVQSLRARRSTAHRKSAISPFQVMHLPPRHIQSPISCGHICDRLLQCLQCDLFSNKNIALLRNLCEQRIEPRLPNRKQKRANTLHTCPIIPGPENLNSLAYLPVGIV